VRFHVLDDLGEALHHLGMAVVVALFVVGEAVVEFVLDVFGLQVERLLEVGGSASVSLRTRRASASMFAAQIASGASKRVELLTGSFLLPRSRRASRQSVGCGGRGGAALQIAACYTGEIC